MSCAKGKDVYPDLMTALIVRDALIQRYAVPTLAYKCLNGCLKWHLTTKWKSGRKIRIWNNIDTPDKLAKYWQTLIEVGYVKENRKDTQRESEFFPNYVAQSTSDYFPGKLEVVFMPEDSDND